LIHDEIAALLKRWVVSPGAAPGASACVGVYLNGAWRYATGAAGVHAATDARPVTPEAIYDLASLTKPVVASALARAIRSGALAWATPLEHVLGEVRGTQSGPVPLELLLAHRAGLEAHLLLAPEIAAGRDPHRRCADARRSECGGAPPQQGFPPVYSDLGYILLGAALAERAAEPLDVIVERDVTAPLGLGLGSARQLRERLGAARFSQLVAPTEDLPARGGLLRGVVHDDNAWALAGEGLAGHAGLFGSALDVARFGSAMLDALAGRSARAWQDDPFGLEEEGDHG
jgi:CubicO group peptidase (beta-lactamase class C family)